MNISEYDGPTAWADMTAVEKMEAWLRGDVAECDEREVFRQAIREAGDERAYRTGLVRENAGLQVKLAESQAEVARLRAALVTAHGALVSAEAALSRAQLSFADRFEEFGAGVAARAVESALEPAR